MAEIQLALQSNRNRAPQLSNETLKNLMFQGQTPDAKNRGALVGCPSIEAFGIAGGEPCRGLWEWQGNAWGVFGDTLYRLDDDGLVVPSGSGIGGTRPVGISDNGVQMIFVNGLKGWTYDSTNGLQLITDPGFPPMRTVAFTDGYFVGDHRDTNQWVVSDLYDGRTWNSLDFASAEAMPGEVTAVVVNTQMVQVFTTTHIELWYNAGGDFPFSRYPGAAPKFGTHSPYAIVVQDGATWFLGADGIYYRMDGNQPRRASTDAIELLISQEPNLADAEAYTLTIQGRKLIFLTLPTTQVTVCYDIKEQLWHDRDSVDENFDSLGRYRGRFALRHRDEVLIGDAFDGRFGKLRWGAREWSEYGNPMRGRIDSITQHNDRLNAFCSRLELDMQFGQATSTGEGADPKVLMRQSRDGGMTYGLLQPPRGMGRIGEYQKRCFWKRRGSARQFSWQFVVDGPVLPTIIAAHADISAGVA